MIEIPFESQKLAYRIDEAVRASGLGRSFLYERIASGELKSIKVGGRRLIPQTELVAFLNRCAHTGEATAQRPAPISTKVQGPESKTRLPKQMDLPL